LLDLDVRALGVDLLTLSAHKFYGPKGVGILYARQGTRLQAQVLGGSQERNRRAGTENVPGAVGAVAALELLRARREEECVRLAELRDRLITGVLDPQRIAGVRLTGHPTLRAPGSASFAFEGVEGESLLLNLDLLGIAASSGSACTTGSVEPSHVLTAMGLTPSAARGHLRLTLGHSSDERDVDAVLEHLPGIVAKLRALSTDPDGAIPHGLG
jgi:cysteine desulfurase